MRNILLFSLAWLLGSWLNPSILSAQNQCDPNCNSTTLLDFSTGWDDVAGALIPIGQIDPHWRLMNTPPTNFAPPASVNPPDVYAINPLNTSWNVIPGSRAVSMANTATFGPNNADPNQPWRFRRYFCVCEDTEVILTGALKADDTGTLTLYDIGGTPTAFSESLAPAPNTNNFNVGISFSQALFLPAGNYYFEFELSNTNAVASGFAVQGVMNSANGLTLYDEQMGCCAVSVITGQKILDQDCNQEFDAGIDQVGSGFVFDLIDDATGMIIATTTSNSFGEFEFNNLNPGNYTVRERPQPGWIAAMQSISVTLGGLDLQTVTFYNCPYEPTIWNGCVYGDISANPTNIHDEQGLALATYGGFFGAANTRTFTLTNIPNAISTNEQLVSKHWDNATGLLQPNPVWNAFNAPEQGTHFINNLHVVNIDASQACSAGAAFATVGTVSNGNNTDVFYSEYNTGGSALNFFDITSTPGFERESVNELINNSNNELVWVGNRITNPPSQQHIFISNFTACPSTINHQVFAMVTNTGLVPGTARSVLELETPLPGYPDATYALTGQIDNEVYVLLLNAGLQTLNAFRYDVDADPDTEEEGIRIRRYRDDLYVVGNLRNLGVSLNPTERIFMLRLGFQGQQGIPTMLGAHEYNLPGGGETVVDAEMNFAGEMILTGVSELPGANVMQGSPLTQKTYLMSIDEFGNPLWTNQLQLQEGSSPSDLVLSELFDEINITGSCWINETVSNPLPSNVRRFDEMTLRASRYGEVALEGGCINPLSPEIIQLVPVVNDFIAEPLPNDFNVTFGGTVNADYFAEPEYCESNGNPDCDFTFIIDCFDIALMGTVTGGGGPYTFEWDVDGDGIPDLTGQNPPVHTYPPVNMVYSVTMTVLDAAGNVICTVTKNIAVRDLVPPVITCPNNITIDTEPGECFGIYEFVPTADDDCDPQPVITCDFNGPQFPKGTTTVTCTATDGSGNSSTCSFTVTVNDVEPPTISCPDPITTFVPACAGGAVINFPPPVVDDNCPMASFQCSHQSGDFFPCGTTLVTCTATDMAGNQTSCTFPVTVNCECAEVGEGELDCTDVDDQFAFSFTVIDLTGAPANACTITATSTQTGVTISGVTVTGSGPAYTINGLVDVTAPPMPNNITITINVSCVCPDGTQHDCSFTRTLATPCCKDIRVDPQEICKDGPSVQIPLLGCGSLYDVQQVRWYVADAPCPPASWGAPFQVTNGCADLILSPQYHNGDVCVYAEVDMGAGAGPCTMLSSNFATITLCEPVSCNLSNDQAYCWTGSSITPAPLTVNLSTTQCLDSIRWFGPNGPIPAADDLLSYQPPALDFTSAATECAQTYTYRVEVSNECGTQSCTASIRLDNDGAPVGTLTLLPPDVNPLCYGEDAVLEYSPECAGEPARWEWFRRPDIVTTYSPLPSNGNQNPLYFTNRLYEDTWVKVEKTNGVCPADEIEYFLDIIDPLVITNFQAAYDDVCAPTLVDLSVDFTPSPADPGCDYTVTWYRNGQVIQTTTGATTSPVTYSYFGTPLYGNYYCEIESSCCPGRVRSQVITLEPEMEIYVDGPCFRCNREIITLDGIIIDPLTGFTCTYQWYNNGSPIPGETGLSLVVDPLWNGPFTFEVTCTDGTVTCVKDASYFITECEPDPFALCEDNLVQNGDFELGTPTTGDEDISNATNWGAIWQPTTGFSTADFYNTSMTLPGGLSSPLPATQDNFGGTWCARLSNQVFREGMMNALTGTIAPNSGYYELTFKVACLGAYSGAPELSIWGVNASGLATGSSPTSATLPNNDGFYGAANSYELGVHPFPATCDEQFIILTFLVNTADPNFPAAGINHLFFTRSDATSGGVYIGLDDVCLRPLDCCESQDAFTDAVQNGFTFTVNGADVTVDNTYLSDCAEMTIDWGDGSFDVIDSSQLPFTHTYTGSNTFPITIDVVEMNGNGNVCFNGQYTDTVTETTDLNDWSTLAVYPNPTTNQITIEYNGLDYLPRLLLLDVHGRVVYQQVYDQPQSRYQISLADLPAGIYLLRGQSSEGKLFTEQVIKQ